MNDKIKKPFFYITFFAFVLAYYNIATAYDYDLWARLIAGMSVVQSGHILKHDFLSYTPTHVWFDHEWGSGVIFYLTQHFFSYAGILILQVSLVFLIFFMMTKIVKLRSVKTTSAYNFLFYYFAFISISYNLEDPIRCQMFSFLFFTVFLYILERARLEKGKDIELIISLPLIMLIWNNLHGGCVSGIGLITLYIIGEFLNRKPVKKYIYALIPTLAVLPINPWGFEYLGFLFKANTMHRADIVEWWNIFCKYSVYNYIKFKLFMAVLLFVEFGVILKQLADKTFTFDKTKFLILAVTIYLAIQHAKLIPFASITMTCFLYDDFYSDFNANTKNVFNKIGKAKDYLIYSFILIFSLININANTFKPLITETRYPIYAIDFIKTNELKGNLLIAFGFGSYASYKLYPNIKILMDGRYEEVYYDNMMPLLKKFFLGNPNWDEILKKYPTDILVIEKFYPIFNILNHNKNWTNIYEDRFFAIFVDSKKVKKTYKPPHFDINYYNKTVFDTNINFMLQSKHEQK